MASLSILLLASTVAIPFQAFAEKPDNTKTPVVILFNDKVSPDKLDLIRSYGGEITRTYTIINGLAANLPQQAIENLENNPSVISIDSDIEFHAIELDADIRIGADQVWTHPTSPATGNGVRVAILDTGIDTDNVEFTGRIIGCESEMGPAEPTCEDLHGHGTHVAGIVGATGVNNSAKGVADDVSYLIDKVLNQKGSGSLSGIIAGMEWAIHPDQNADIISMSLGTNPYYDQSADHCDLWYQSMTNAVNNAVASGVTVVAAAGNSGASGVGLPACISNTIAVAAVDDNDNIAYFSSIGGAVRHHGISAPGMAIYSSLPGNTYASWSGTSMATPVVAGTIALLLEGDVTLSPANVKEALFNTACTSSTSPSCSSIPDTPSTNYGYGRVNAIAAFDSILGYTGPPLPDADEDGYTSNVDCDDNNPLINPGAIDIPYDGIDQDCSGADLDDVDQDGSPSTQAVGGIPDCDDTNPLIHPGAIDIPENGIDEDCSGSDAPFPDADEDGYTSDVDCDDTNPLIHPGAIDIPGNGIDEDCDGADAVPEIHLGDLSATTSGKKNWTGHVTIMIHQAFGGGHTPIFGVTVSGTWSGDSTGSASCITDTAGQCQVKKTTKGNSLTFTVDTLTMNVDPTFGIDDVSPTIIINKGDGGGSDGGGGGKGGPDCNEKPNHPKC